MTQDAGAKSALGSEMSEWKAADGEMLDTLKVILATDDEMPSYAAFDDIIEVIQCGIEASCDGALQQRISDARAGVLLVGGSGDIPL